MLLDLYTAQKKFNNQEFHLRTPSPLDHSEFEYIHYSPGIPFCQNFPYTTWLMKTHKLREPLGIRGARWEEYIVDQVFVLRYNNPGISRLAVGILMSMMKTWGVNIGVFRDKDITNVVSVAFNDFPEDWKPSERASHWYSQTVEKLELLPGESYEELSKRKSRLKNKLRTESNDLSNRELVKRASERYQSERGGLVPTPDILATNVEKSRYIVVKVSDEGEDWQRKGAFTEQCVSLALDINPSLTNKEIASIISNELPSGSITEQGVSKARRKLKQLSV